MSNITKEIAQFIVDKYIAGSTLGELAEQYEVHRTTIGYLVSGKTWKECVRPCNIKEIMHSRMFEHLSKGGHNAHSRKNYSPLTDVQKQIIDGSLLGDGYLDKVRGTLKESAFIKNQCCKFQEHIEWISVFLRPYTKWYGSIWNNQKIVNTPAGIMHHKVEKYRIGYGVRTIHHPIFTNMRKQWYPNGIKIVPRDLVITNLVLAVWFVDDGSNCWNKRRASLSTQSFSLDDVCFLASSLQNRFHINPSIVTQWSVKENRHQPILIFTGANYDRLIELVSPHIVWNCFKYKCKYRKAAACEDRNYRSGECHHSAKLNCELVKEIRKLSKKGVSQRKLASLYGVSQGMIGRIVREMAWKNVE